MYKVESFLTSFILSYADKYIKDFKKSDAQLSLWEGEAYFHNLELDPLALEDLVPFHFVSGHINELKIKVPWTSLGSSPVEVVIDTIECVMKFKSPESDKSTSNAADTATAPKDAQDPSSPSPTLDPTLAPLDSTGSNPSLPAAVESSNSTYMLSLTRRVLSNLKIVCNNVILKIMEEDTVLSLNIKTIQAESVNGHWMPAFTELSPKELFLRKRIKLNDITLCLDRRSPSGHIVTFLEPLLFKCSLELRLLQQYDKATYASRLTRLDISCDQMSFIISKPQLYLLVKILELVVNLKKVISKQKTTSSHPTSPSPPPHATPTTPSSPSGKPPHLPPSNTSTSGEARPCAAMGVKDISSGSQGGGAGASSPASSRPTSPTPEDGAHDSSGGGWWGWAWNMLPSLLGDEELDPAHDTVTGHTLRIGLYIKQVLVSLKLLELSQSAGATENTKYAPVISLQMDGIFAEQTSHNENWVNLQAGVDNIILSSNGPCPCGHKSLDSPAASSEILVRNAQPSNHGNAQQQYYNERFERTKWRQAKAKVKRLKPDLKDKHSQMVHNFHHQSSITHDNSANPPPNTVEHSTDERKGNNDLQDGSEGVKPNNDLTDGSAGVKPDEQARIGVTDTAGEHATKPDPQHDQSSDQQVDPFLDGSLFSPHPKFVPLSKPFWADHINSLDEAAMLNRSGALYLDVVRSLEIVSVQEEHEEEEGLLEEKNDIGIVQEKMLLRTVLAPLLIKLNTSLVHRISYILRLLTDTMQAVRPFASTGEEKKGVTLTEDTMSLYCAGLIPFNVIQVAIFRPIIELYPLGEHPTPPPTTNKPNDTKDATDSYSGATKDSSYGSPGKNDPVDYGPKLSYGSKMSRRTTAPSWSLAGIRPTFGLRSPCIENWCDCFWIGREIGRMSPSCETCVGK
uniref:Vacuolar protein sorting-associated protein 13B n=1 Tax=Cacopsylla melanoneura TaxID=428564 RepID=A0A8D8Z1B7_9HEMI